MTGLKQVLSLRHGQSVQIVSPLGEARVMKVMVGDALLHGHGQQIWLLDEITGHYMRQLPEHVGDLGKALFYSYEEVFSCIETRNFYFA